MIRRLFVEKKQPVEAQKLLQELNESFGNALTSVRILNRYEIENLASEHFETAKRCIFSEPMADEVYEDRFPMGSDEWCFAVEYLPGQYNQRADSALQCLQILTRQSDCLVTTAKLYALRGQLSDPLFDKIKRYLINPVDSREAAMEVPSTLQPEFPAPRPVAVVTGFTGWSHNQLGEYWASAELAMSFADIVLIQQHFEKEGRDPTAAEIRVLDTYWSDHCRHTTFSTNIEQVEIEKGHFNVPLEDSYQHYMSARHELFADKPRDLCLMDIATIGMKQLKAMGKLEDLDESEEINACSIRVEVEAEGKHEPWLIMFKNETHNHPTEIEPFGGAATCLGGAIRDPLSGRSYVYQAMRITGAGDPRTPLEDTLAGKLPQKRLTQEAAHGFSSYGNQIGLATGHVREIYHSGFVAKRMEIGAVVGAVPADNVVRLQPKAGDVVLLVGGRTGRDGCGGATGSSRAHTESSILTCGAEVQKGNPVVERKIQRLFRNGEASRLIKRCNDFGAGGVAVAVGELADGLDINLDAVPKKYEGLDGTELAISESQERMAVVVSPQDADRFAALCLAENLECTPIAIVTDNRRLRMTWQGVAIVELSRELMDSNGAKQTTRVRVTLPQAPPFAGSVVSQNVRAHWLAAMGDLNVCSQKGLAEQFDASIGAGTVLMPFGGKTQLTPAEVSVCKVPLLTGETTTATILAHGYDPVISEWSPFHGAVYSVVSLLAKVTACGGDYTRTRLSFQEYFERLGFDEDKWGKPFSGLMGAYYAQLQTGCAAIGGKDSMSGSYNDLTVPPTVAAFGVCVCDTKTVISPEFKQSGSAVVFVSLQGDTYHLPDFTALKETYTLVHQKITEGHVLAAHTVDRFGMATALAKMSFGNNIGVKLTNADSLFSSHVGSLVLEMTNTDHLPPHWIVVGKTQSKPQMTINQLNLPISELLAAWQSTLEGIFPSKAANPPETVTIPKTARGKRRSASLKVTKPRVLIPVFPGTNCEIDSLRAFERAGAQVDTLIFKNLTAQDIDASLSALKAAIDKAQIVMLAGGFSAGDEPDGSAKFITAVFRNPAICEAVRGLLSQRDGLMLGICNGFQALLKLGLLTYGDIAPVDRFSPTLSYNTLGRHISQIATTRIISTKSPWLYGVRSGDLHSVPISHGEGRFIADRDTLQALFDKGQVASVYQGENPNGSSGGVEGLISPCGRILGKMGHSERFSIGTYKNISGKFDQRIFESGVAYYKV